MFDDYSFDPSSPSGNLDSVRLSDASPTSPRTDLWSDFELERRQNISNYFQDSLNDNEPVSKYEAPPLGPINSAEDFIQFNYNEDLYQGYQHPEVKKQSLIFEEVAYKQEQPEDNDNEEKEYAELQPVEELNNKLGDIFQMAMRNSPSPPPVEPCTIQRGCESPSYIAIMDEIHTAASSYSASKPAPPPPAPVAAPAKASRHFILLPVQVELQPPASIPVRGRGRPRATGPAPTPEAEYMRQYRLRQKQKKAAAAAKH